MFILYCVITKLYFVFKNENIKKKTFANFTRFTLNTTYMTPLLNIGMFKIKIKNIINYQEPHQKMQNCTSLFQQIFTVYKIFPVGIKTKNLPRKTRFGLCFIKVFYKTITCPRQLLLSVPKSGHLIHVCGHVFFIFTIHNVYFYNEHSLKYFLP